jgi:hypothetical protein
MSALDLEKRKRLGRPRDEVAANCHREGAILRLESRPARQIAVAKSEVLGKAIRRTGRRIRVCRAHAIWPSQLMASLITKSGTDVRRRWTRLRRGSRLWPHRPVLAGRSRKASPLTGSSSSSMASCFANSTMAELVQQYEVGEATICRVLQ